MTGYWYVVEGHDPQTTGSVGAGVNLTPIRVGPRDGSPGVYFWGTEGIVFKTYLDSFSYLGLRPIAIEAYSRPLLGIGYGMSAGLSMAGLLLAGVHTVEEAGRAVHSAEVLNRTGYGDVVAIIRGGLEVRRFPGGPGHAVVESVRVDGDPDVVALETGSETTPEMLRRVGEKVSAVGPEIHRYFLEDPSLERFVEASQRFSLLTGLMDKTLHDELAERLRTFMRRGSLIGFHRKKNIVLVYVDKGLGPEVADSLSGMGYTEVLKISRCGLRIIDD